MLITKYHQFLKQAGFLFLQLMAVCSFAQTTPAPVNTALPFNTVLLIVIALLFVFIILLSVTVNGAMGLYLSKTKEKKESNSAAKTVTVLLLLLFTAHTMVAQTTTTAVTPATSSGGSIISPETFRYLLYMTIIIEVCIIFFFIRLIYFFTDISLFQKTETEIEGTEGKVSQSWLSKWWAKMNNFTATVEEESKLDSGHNYDGIRELDNNIPPWWTVTFIATIIFAGIYLYRYHIAHSAPLSHEEYEIAMKEAGLEKEALLKSEANKVDENTVKMLDAAGIEAGKNTFIKTCAPCHGPDGQGIVGPNLTDDYWLHKGSISDIFRSIKYGWVEKGMKSWKDDFSPMQIAQLASYVKSLRGSNPPNAKDKQGDLYVDTPSGAVASADTSAVKSK